MKFRDAIAAGVTHILQNRLRDARGSAFTD